MPACLSICLTLCIRYVFKGHPIPSKSEADDSLVKIEDTPTPEVIRSAFEMMGDPGAKGKPAVDERKILFVNAQWAIGGEATGAPVHYHNAAWNALVYGAKKWIIYPPHHQIMSNMQIKEYFETDMQSMAQRGVTPQTCVQTAGDVMIIPENWGHGILNIQVDTIYKFSFLFVSFTSSLT